MTIYEFISKVEEIAGGVMYKIFGLKENDKEKERQLRKICREFLGLPEKVDFDEIMQQWDLYRKYIADGHKSSLPRDWFETVLDIIRIAWDE